MEVVELNQLEKLEHTETHRLGTTDQALRTLRTLGVFTIPPKAKESFSHIEETEVPKATANKQKGKWVSLQGSQL